MSKLPSTPALRMLKDRGVSFEVHPYRYEPKGGTRASSAALGVEEHVVIKTLVFETSEGDPVVVLMHGDREVSTKSLARVLGVKATRPAPPAAAERWSGYRLGGCSPFGLKRAMPVLAEATIFDLDRIFINGGARGVLVSLAPSELDRVLEPRRVSVAA